MDFLIKNILKIAIEKKIILTAAESCTGGMVSASLTKTSGSSKIFDCGFVVYSNNSKKKILGVSEHVLNTYGSTSKQAAMEMALGAIENSLADIAVSCTGIAEPVANSELIGFVYISIFYLGWSNPFVWKYCLEKKRNENINQIVNKTLNLINLVLNLI